MTTVRFVPTRVASGHSYKKKKCVKNVTKKRSESALTSLAGRTVVGLDAQSINAKYLYSIVNTAGFASETCSFHPG